MNGDSSYESACQHGPWPRCISNRPATAMTGIVGDAILGSADVARGPGAPPAHPPPPSGGRRGARRRLDRRPVDEGPQHLPHHLVAARVVAESPILIIVVMLGRRHAPAAAGRRAFAAHPDPPGRDRGRSGGPGGDRRDKGRGRALHQPVPGPPDLPRHHGRHGPARRPVRGASGDGQDLRGQGHGQGGQRPLPLRVGLGLPVDVLRADQPQDPLLLQAAAQARPNARAGPSGS